MKFLLTNDDGIDAPGLAALEQALRPWAECVVIAPTEHLSGCSHQATTARGLTLNEVGPARYALDGTPVDCTRVGLSQLMPDCDWVVAGINCGGNLGADVYHSGTVAAARESALCGGRGIAVSHYVRRGVDIDWTRAAEWTSRMVRSLVERYREQGTLWNVNLPHLDPDGGSPDVVFCQLDPHPLPVNYRNVDGKLQYYGRYPDRARQLGRDVDVCFSGHIAVTQLLLS